MAIEKKELVEGIKTFFVVPDLSIMPEDFLPNFFLKGFEAYYLLDDQYLDIRAKIRVLYELFPEMILFFNTDRKLGDLVWQSYIKELQEEYGERARIGVLYGVHIAAETRRRMERAYLYDIGINCGCIPIGYRKATNLSLLSGVLTANQANGRRKYLRAICGETCELNFMRDRVKVEGRILDISISHFSCEFYGVDPEIRMYEKASDIQLKLAGIICTVDAVLFTRRVIGASVVNVFVFRDSRGKDGLDSEMLSKVNGFIRERFDRGVGAIVRRGFEEELARRRESKVGAKQEAKVRAKKGGRV
jgi:hypothetical protein